MELHCNVAVVKVGEKSNTAAAASAYISCTKTVGHDERIHDYSKKAGFVADGFLLPENVPERWHKNPTSMWAEQDLIDYTKSTRRGQKSELYRAGRIGLPWDISHERAAELAEELLEPLRKKGMCVQWAIHDVVEDGKRNYHLHWMAAMREVTPEGFGKKCREWNKYNGGLNIPELLRPHVAGILNRELEAVGSNEHVEHESFEARGIDKLPTRHKGAAATAIERKARKKQKAKGDPQYNEHSYTRAQRRNTYITWLNQIHAANLRQVEEQARSGNLDDLIGNAKMERDGAEVFKDWDALFAMLRDARRCRAAFKGEVKKLDKITGAYARLDAAETEEERQKERSYLEWAGCDPDDKEYVDYVKHMQHEARIGIREMDVTEKFLLDSKELLKARNRAIYTAKKASWDEYQIHRNESGIEYCDRRIDSINRYMDYLGRSITIIDILFNTEAFRTYRREMAELEAEKRRLRDERWEKKEKLKQAKKDLKEHKAEARNAAREGKKAERQYRREHR